MLHYGGAKKPSPRGILEKKLDFSLSKCRNQKAKTSTILHVRFFFSFEGSFDVICFL